jgi:hypothetical protein
VCYVWPQYDVLLDRAGLEDIVEVRALPQGGHVVGTPANFWSMALGDITGNSFSQLGGADKGRQLINNQDNRPRGQAIAGVTAPKAVTIC